MNRPPVTTPIAGFELCYECDGLRTCLTCLGEGTYLDGSRCETCGGNGYCFVCRGAGEMTLGTHAKVRAGASDADEPAWPPPGKRVARTVGKLRELGDDDAPPLATARGTRSDDNLAAVVAYLRAGKLLVMSPGLVKDPLDAESLAGKRSMRTDGVYAWSDALAYFVERYRIELPAEFERHMATRQWAMPATIDTKDLVPG